MGYLDRLKAQKPAPARTDKTDKTGYVSFVSASDSPISTIAADEREEVRQHLIRLLPGEDHRDFGEAFALALEFPGALECLRASIPPKGAA